MQAILLYAAGSVGAPGPGAVAWIAALVTGPLGTGLAVCAVAFFGFTVLGGHLSLRRGSVLVIGCFILFSAPALAAALMGLAHGTTAGTSPRGFQRIEVPPPPVPATPPAYDPYAGASLPN